MQDITVARLQSTIAETPLSPSFKCNVLRETISVDSQNIPCATLKRSGSWVISVYSCCGDMYSAADTAINYQVLSTYQG
jgi:hypothetical protein